jgi:hypothetical protein
LEAGAAQEAQPADGQPQPQDMPPQAMNPPQPMPMPMPTDPNAVSSPTAILGAQPPYPGAVPYPYPYPYPPNAPVPPFGDAAAAAQYAALYGGAVPPPGVVAQPGMPMPPYPPQYPYGAPYAQQPLPLYPGQWPGYVPPGYVPPGYVPPGGQPPNRKRTGAIAGGAAAVIVVIAVILAIALSGSNSPAGLGASPSQSGQPTYYPPVDIPTNFPTGLPTADLPTASGPTSITLPATAGPYTKLTDSQAQSLVASVQSTVTAQQTTLGGPLQVGVYGNGGESTGSLTAIVIGNAVGALPTLTPTIDSANYSTYVHDFAQLAGMQDAVYGWMGSSEGSVCGGAPASDGSTIAECVWIDDETFCIVEFSPAITGNVTGELNFAEYDAQELRSAIDTA